MGGEAEGEDEGEEEVVLSGGYCYSPYSRSPSLSLGHGDFMHHQPFHNLTNTLARKAVLGMESGGRPPLSLVADPRRGGRSRSSSVGSDASAYYDGRRAHTQSHTTTCSSTTTHTPLCCTSVQAVAYALPATGCWA